MRAESGTIRVKTILSEATGYLNGFHILAPYMGCSFGCLPCYVPTLHTSRVRGLAKGWGQQVFAKENGPALLLAEGKAGRLATKRIYCAPNTDPFVPEERQFRVTRDLLEVLCRYPPALLVLQTRSPLVADCDVLDLLKHLRERLVVGLSIPTDRDDVRRVFEPYCPSINVRLMTLEKLARAGIRTQASLAPLLPCNPERLAGLVEPHCEWVVAQPLKYGEPGARTWAPALQLLHERKLEGWLQGGAEVRAAMARLQHCLGAKYHEGREGFNLRWLR